jgi:peptidyl-tRNA hydrolase
MEIKIGVQYSPREISLESEEKQETISSAVDAAISGGSLLKLTDDRGRTVIIPGDKITYVELGPATSRKVGFGH